LRATGADRGADGEFFSPGVGAYKQQIADIRAGDEQNQCNGSLEQPDGRSVS
jgi:hypothetical protein